MKIGESIMLLGKWRKIAICLMACTALSFSAAEMESKIFEGDGRFIVGDGFEGNLSTAKERAKDHATKNASMKAGVFISSLTVVKDFSVTEDEIRTISANILQIQGDPEFKIDTFGDEEDQVTRVRCHLSALVDDSNVIEAFKDRKHLDDAVKQNLELEKRKKQNDLEIEELRNDYLNAKNDDERKKIQDRIAKNDREFTANQYLEAGNRAFFAKNYDEAIKNYNKVLEMNPNDVEAYTSRGLSYFIGKDDCDKAIEDYSKAIELKPDDPNLYTFRANVYGFITKSTPDISKKIKYASLLRSDSLKSAELIQSNANKIADNLFNGDFETAKKLSDEYLEKEKQNYPKKIAEETKLIEKGEKFRYWYRGTLHEHMGELDQAIADYTRAIEFEPDKPLNYSSRGTAYSKQKKYDLAIADLNKAIELSPQNESYSIYMMRGNIYKEMGDREHAIADYEKVLELVPSKEYFASLGIDTRYIDLTINEAHRLIDELKNQG